MFWMPMPKASAKAAESEAAFAGNGRKPRSQTDRSAFGDVVQRDSQKKKHRTVHLCFRPFGFRSAGVKVWQHGIKEFEKTCARSNP